MSLFVKIMIGGWAGAIAMIAGCALHQSGRLLEIRERVALWLGRSVVPVEDSLEEVPQSGSREVA